MRFLPLLLTLGLLLPLSAWADPIAVGSPAPQVKAVDQDGKPVDLGALCATGYTLVYFYPKADTPGCTSEACHLRDAFSTLTDKGIRVVGVSKDDPDSQKKFQTKYHLPFTLLADPDHTISNAFGVPSTLGFDKRQSFLIKDGNVVWSDLKANPATQADEVLQEVAAK